MILAQRGDVQNIKDYSSFAAAGPARVLRFVAENPDAAATPGLWQIPPEEYAVGNGTDNRSSSGGVALEYSFNADGTIDTNACSGTIVASADALGPERAVHGVQLNAVGLVRPANVPPNESAFVNWKPVLDDAQARGYAGGVAVLHSCDARRRGLPARCGGRFGRSGLPACRRRFRRSGASAGRRGTARRRCRTPDVSARRRRRRCTTPPVVEGGGGGKITSGPFTVEKTGVSEECNETDPCTFDDQSHQHDRRTRPRPDRHRGYAERRRCEPGHAKLSGAPNAPWTCSFGRGRNSPATHPGPFQPNTPETLTLSFGLGPLGEATEVKNCVRLAVARHLPPPDEPPEEQGLRVAPRRSRPRALRVLRALGRSPPPISAQRL